MGHQDMIEIGGAGPAGLAAAIVLARRGRRVRVLERSGVVGRRFHDDFQGMENWTTARDAHEELRGLGIEPTWWHQAFCEGELFDASFSMARVRAPLPLFYCVRRGPQHHDSLDNALLRQAREAGVEVCFHRRADPAAVQVFAGGPVGRPMAVARGLNFPIRHRDVGCQVLSDSLTPNGYVYFVVADGRATLGTVLVHQFGDSKERLRSAVEAIKRLYALQVPDDASEWGGYACFTLAPSGVRGSTLYAGEAAGIQDALFGFGIRSSLLSGALAGAALAEGSSYDEAWRRRVMPLTKASLLNRAVYERVGFARPAFRRLMDWSEDGRRALRFVYGGSVLHRLGWPLACWLDGQARAKAATQANIARISPRGESSARGSTVSASKPSSCERT